MSKKLNMLSAAYSKLISAIGVEINENGKLIQTVNDLNQQVTVDGLELFLPTVDNTRNYNESTVLFHPLSENVLLGESPVIKETRALMMDNLHYLILETVDAMLKIGVDNDMVSKLSPTQIETLRCTAGVDETTIKNWKSIMRRAESRGSANRVVTIFLKRGAEIDDKDYKRAAIVNFNIYNELVDGKLNIFGVKIRKADLNIYVKTLETIIDDIAIIDKYSVGSNSLVAPYFDALIRAYAGILKTINGVTWNLRKPIKEVKGVDLHVKDEFSELFTDLLVYRDIIPSLPYNDGDRNDRRDKHAVKDVSIPQEQPKPEPIPEHLLPGTTNLAVTNNQYYAPNLQQPPVAVPQQPVMQQAPAQEPPKHVSQQMPSIEEQLYGGQQIPVQPVPWHQPQSYGYNQFPVYQQPFGYPQPQAPVQPQTGNYGSWANAQPMPNTVRPWYM